eukprot:Polyplicarium_translucidae@DN2218_c0_g1_i4.p1
MKEVVETARQHDPALFLKAVETVLEEQQSNANKWAVTPLEELAAEFNTSLTAGLTAAQVVANREAYGANVLDQEYKEPIWKIFLSQFTSFVVILLLVAAIVSLGFQEWAEGTVILIIVFFNAFLATYMEKSAGDALAKLASMAAPKCRVLRDADTSVIDAVDLVPGDIVFLEMGDNVPADVRCVEAIELKTNEALLTGESEDIKKTLKPKDATSPFATNLCFASTSCTTGSGKALTFATGMETQVGRIAKQLAKESSKGSRLTPLQRALNKLGGIIGIMAICVLVVIVIVAVVTDYHDPSHPDADPVLQIILVAVGFAVSSIPEGLPMVVTVCLALGCRDMVNQKANVRKLPAVETLGCCTVICSDKTGTLTEGKMTAICISSICRGAENAVQNYSFYPTKGFNPIGGIFATADLTEPAKAQIVARIEQTDTAEPTDFSGVIPDYGAPGNDTPQGVRVRSLALAGALNSHATALRFEESSQQWHTTGNMSEGAIVVAAAKARYGTAFPHHVNHNAQFKRIAECEVPFTSARKMMATVHALPTPGSFNGLKLGDQVTHVIIVKGAPDRVGPKCRRVLRERAGVVEVDWESEIQRGELDALARVNEEFSARALRVLAFAIVPLTTPLLESMRACEDADGRLHFALAQPLIALGVMGSLDPPRFGVKDAILKCYGAGVRVTMITGDQRPTAAAVGREIGLLTPTDSEDSVALVCADLHVNGDLQAPFLSDEDLDDITARVKVFSRAQPEDKIEIVNSLKRRGHVTAMTGDGVNDSPALKAADIGIAMGINGTDVAKGASEMVLLDDNFVTIVCAIEEGRRIYGNIQKFVAFLLGTNIGEIIYLTVSIVSGMKMPVEALQILFLNLMSDGCPAIALCREPADEGNMRMAPRSKNAHIITKELWLWAILPHTVFEALCVVSCLATAMYMASGVVTLNQIADQCRTADFQDSSIRYYCESYEYRFNTKYTGWVTNIDYLDDDGILRQYLGVVAGKDGPLHADDVPDYDGCTPGVDGDDNGFCLPTSPAGTGYDFVTTRASRIATTQSFVCAVYCEMFRAYTVRSWEYATTVFNRNAWMHLACSLSATSTLALTIIPWLNSIFGVMGIQWWQYGFSIGLGLLNTFLDEMIPKALYRRFVLPKSEQTKAKERAKAEPVVAEAPV